MVILRWLNYAAFMWWACFKPMFLTPSEETNSSKLTRNYELQGAGDVGLLSDSKQDTLTQG